MKPASISIIRRILPLFCTASVTFALFSVAQAGTLQLVPNTNPTPVEVNGKRYVIIKKDETVSFKVAQPPGLISLKWNFSNASPVGDKSGVGPH